MDKNTIIGFLLILAIMVGFSYYNRPSQEELERQRAMQDSIQMVQMQEQAIREAEHILAQQLSEQSDSQKVASASSLYGEFASFVIGEKKETVLENDLIKVYISNKGGAISSVELKNYTTNDGRPLILFDQSDARQNITFVTKSNRVVDTENLYFTPKAVGDSIVEMSLPFENGALRFTYKLSAGSYLVDYDIKADNMSDYLSLRDNGVDMEWSIKMRQQERGQKFENRYSALYYKFKSGDVECLEAESNDSENTTGKIQWIGIKDQFFSSVIIAKGDDSFSSVNLSSELLSNERSGGFNYLKHLKSQMLVDFDPSGATSTQLQYFFGPNQYKVLCALDDNLSDDEKLYFDEMLPLGWGIFGWVNKYFIIPIFNFLGNYFVNYGLIIFLLTIIIKLILLPLTYKSYLSTAKMRVLRPQIEEINARIPEDKAMERQQATMNLYRSSGVSPMGGCLPMLLQMPILFAMFTFFPSCIELRQQAFLWADDLSTFDSILSWDTYIPIISSIYGNHVSLFCLLMCITNLVYTYINMKDQPGNNQMPAMKYMMYFMPIMFLFIFNDYASGLSYYYFVSLLITIGQTFLFRLFVNDEKLLSKMEENKKKPQKKSGFMARLEKMQREQLAMQREQAKRRK